MDPSVSPNDPLVKSAIEQVRFRISNSSSVNRQVAVVGTGQRQSCGAAAWPRERVSQRGAVLWRSPGQLAGGEGVPGGGLNSFPSLWNGRIKVPQTPSSHDGLDEDSLEPGMGTALREMEGRKAGEKADVAKISDHPVAGEVLPSLDWGLPGMPRPATVSAFLLLSLQCRASDAPWASSPKWLASGPPTFSSGTWFTGTLCRCHRAKRAAAAAAT